MTKIVRKSTRDLSGGPVGADRWPVYPTRREQALEPTGKWAVPKYEGLTRKAVKKFFKKHCKPDNDARFKAYVQDIDDDRFLVYLDGCFHYPRPSTRFLDGTLIREWHMTTSAYWNTMRVYNEEFREFATHHAYDQAPTVHIQRGARYYPGEGDERIADLPPTARSEGFRMKLQHMQATVARVTLQSGHYYAYMRALVNSHGPGSLPLITDTVSLDKDRLQLTLKYASNNLVTACIVAMLPTETSLVTIAFSTD